MSEWAQVLCVSAVLNIAYRQFVGLFELGIVLECSLYVQETKHTNKIKFSPSQ